jgi:hypothetical protein
MGFCTKCGEPLADNFRFCGKCGTPVQAALEAFALSAIGKGKDTTTSGAIYEGKKKYITTTGAVYEVGIASIGTRVGESNGKEKYTDEDGNVYEGDFDEDELNGEGKIIFENGAVYEGDFIEGVPEGKGKLKFPDGEVWEGDFVDGRLNGQGKLTTADGFIKEGDFVNSNLDGEGRITNANSDLADSDLIEGYFIEGKLNGKGKFAIAGDKYEGDFVDGVPDGKGIYAYADGDVYNGEFSGGEKHGKGIYTFPDGDVWEGTFVDGKVSATFTIAKDNEASDAKITEPELKTETEDDFAIKEMPAEFNKAVLLYEAKRYDEAFPLFLAFANEGNIRAGYYLGLCYFTGSGVELDNDKAVEYLSMSAALKDKDAQDMLEVLKKLNMGEGIDYQQKFDDDFRELFTQCLKENKDFGCELWSAQANVRWYHTADPDETDCGHGFRGAGALIAEMLGEGDYIEWYCSGPYETVSDYIAEKMATKGWRYELEGDQ